MQMTPYTCMMLYSSHCGVKASVAPEPAPSADVAEPRAEGEPMPDLTKLNWKELQDALYRAHELRDTPETREDGARRVRAIREEYARRGVRAGPPAF